MRGSLKLPIVLAVVMIVILSLLMTGWVIVTLWAAWEETAYETFYWVLLPIGAVFLSVIFAGVITYLVLSIQMINLNGLQSNFIDSITHELKTPLASAKLTLQMMTRYEFSRNEQLAFYKQILEDTDRLDMLVNQVIRAGQLDAGMRIADQPEEFLLREFLLEVIFRVLRHHGIPETCLHFHCSEHLSVVVSKALLEIIFRNLIDNAIKYGGKPPRVSVSVCHSSRGWVVLRVQDNGQGVPSSKKHKIFRRFVRLGNELERTQKGTGLGLYLVKMCVKQVHGKIRVRNHRKSGGACFYFFFPSISKQKNSSEQKDES